MDLTQTFTTDGKPLTDAEAEPFVRAIGVHLSDRTARAITDHGTWGRRIVKVTLGGWRITKLTSLGDVMWWDPAYDVACLRYPPFGQVTPTLSAHSPHPRGRRPGDGAPSGSALFSSQVRPAYWAAFLRGYGPEPERKRLLLYLVLQRLCAGGGVYMAPHTVCNKAWAKHCLDDLDAILDEIEKL